MLLVLYVGTVWLSPLYFAGFLSLILLPALLEWGTLMGLTRRVQQSAWIACFAIILLVMLLVLTRSMDSPDAQAAMLFDTRIMTILMALATLFWLWVFLVISRYPRGQQVWEARWKIGLMGIACLLPTWLGLFYLKLLAPSGILVFILVALVSVVDIGAYFSGRAWGRKKLAPLLSPGKSWAGFWGGLASCLTLSIGILLWLHFADQTLSAELWILLMACAMLLAVLSVVGDLFESMLKRHRGLKDSGRTLPGHGGVLDRIDSLVAATPVYVLALIMLSRVMEVI